MNNSCETIPEGILVLVFRLGPVPKTNHGYDLLVIGRKSLDLPAVGPQLEQSTSLGFDLRPELTRGVWDALLD